MKKIITVDNYQIEHIRHGCYEVKLVDETKEAIDKKSIVFVIIDPETSIPTPDFK